jgi:hypothetical protein
VVLAKFEVLVQYLPGAAEENIEKRLSIQSPGQDFSLGFPKQGAEIIPT